MKRMNGEKDSAPPTRQSPHSTHEEISPKMVISPKVAVEEVPLGLRGVTMKVERRGTAAATIKEEASLFTSRTPASSASVFKVYNDADPDLNDGDHSTDGGIGGRDDMEGGDDAEDLMTLDGDSSEDFHTVLTSPDAAVLEGERRGTVNPVLSGEITLSTVCTRYPTLSPHHSLIKYYMYTCIQLHH